jgi:hypothetical protein
MTTTNPIPALLRLLEALVERESVAGQIYSISTENVEGFLKENPIWLRNWKDWILMYWHAPSSMPSVRSAFWKWWKKPSAKPSNPLQENKR